MSVIVPVWRDDDALEKLLGRWRHTAGVELIVALALEEAPRYARLQQRHPSVRWATAPRGRASQMNAGAAIATGSWLLFLHADSQLPETWCEDIASADRTPGVVAGAFRFALDSTDWRARVIEYGVRLRIAVFGVPYGDQGIFVRRSVFEAIGGYRDLPLMEDIDLVRRLKAAGRPYFPAARVTTSARRWERDGWLQCSGRNLIRATRFLLGASPAALARDYFDRHRSAVVLVARAPWEPGKTRLSEAIGAAAHAELREALFADALAVLDSSRDAERIVACEPASAAARMQTLVGPAIDVIVQRGESLGERLAHAVDDARRLGCESVVVFGSDVPDLPVETVERARALLESGARHRIVIGPATDGGYYLIGLNASHPALFQGIEWSTPRVLAQTIDRARHLHLEVHLLEQRRDVDTAQDVQTIVESGGRVTGARTREWSTRYFALKEE